MWSGCYLTSESFGEEINVPVWEAEGSDYGLFGLCSHRPRLWTFYIPLDADSQGMVLIMPQVSFGGSYMPSQMIDDTGDKRKTQFSPLKCLHFSWWEWLNANL